MRTEVGELIRDWKLDDVSFGHYDEQNDFYKIKSYETPNNLKSKEIDGEFYEGLENLLVPTTKREFMYVWNKKFYQTIDV